MAIELSYVGETTIPVEAECVVPAVFARKTAKEIAKLGIPGVILFGIPEEKDESGSEAHNPKGVVQEAIRRLKDKTPDLVVITDVCMCEYTSHGHCGVIVEGDVDNDATLDRDHGTKKRRTISHEFSVFFGLHNCQPIGFGLIADGDYHFLNRQATVTDCDVGTNNCPLCIAHTACPQAVVQGRRFLWQSRDRHQEGTRLLPKLGF